MPAGCDYQAARVPKRIEGGISRAVPKQNLRHIFSPVNEEEHVACHRISAQAFAHHGCQAVKTLASVHRLDGSEDPNTGRQR